MTAHGLSAAERFWMKVDKTDTCWLWTAAKISGYGRFALKPGRMVIAHRWSYEQIKGPIPQGLTLDHLCRVRNCVNPDHLEPVTHAENQARRPEKAECPRGHAYDEANTYRAAPPADGRRAPRHCRECNRLRSRARYYAERAVSA